MKKRNIFVLSVLVSAILITCGCSKYNKQEVKSGEDTFTLTNHKIEKTDNGNLLIFSITYKDNERDGRVFDSIYQYSIKQGEKELKPADLSNDSKYKKYATNKETLRKLLKKGQKISFYIPVYLDNKVDSITLEFYGYTKETQHAKPITIDIKNKK